MRKLWLVAFGIIIAIGLNACNTNAEKVEYYKEGVNANNAANSSFELSPDSQFPPLSEPPIRLSVRPSVTLRENLPAPYCEPITGISRPFASDAEFLVSELETTHPMFILEGRLYIGYEALREEYLRHTSEQMTHTEFVLATQRFLAPLGDGHLGRTFTTRQGLFQDGSFIDLTFIARPYGMFLADENGVITNYEVIGIGGVCIEIIFDIVDTYYARYNEFGRLRNHSRYSRYELMLRRAGAQLITYNGRLTTELSLWQEYPDGGTLTHKFVMFTEDHPSNYRVSRIYPEFSYEHKGDIVYIRLYTLIVNEARTAELIQVIRGAMDDGARKFIIDLRNNPGGFTFFAHELLLAMGMVVPVPGNYIRIGEQIRPFVEEHLRASFSPIRYEELLDEGIVFSPPHTNPENPYGVFIVVLVNRYSFSAAPMFAGYIVDSGFGVVIGEPPSSGPAVSGTVLNIDLPLSGIRIRSTYTSLNRIDLEADPQVLWPDIWVNEWEALDVALELLADLD